MIQMNPAELDKQSKHALLPQQVTESCDGILGVFDKLVFGLVAYILRKKVSI